MSWKGDDGVHVNTCLLHCQLGMSRLNDYRYIAITPARDYLIAGALYNRDIIMYYHAAVAAPLNVFHHGPK